MDLLQHAMDILGVGSDQTFTASDIKPGYTVTKVEWNGCMAERREEVDIGYVVRHVFRNSYQWVIVNYDERGMVEEPLAHFRRNNDELEVWS